MKKLWRWLRIAFTSLFFGMKRTEEATLKATNLHDDVDSGIEEQVTENRVSRALLRGEITQAVKELRYRTYRVDREAKSVEYYSPFLTSKRDKVDSKIISYENSDNFKLIVIQPNFAKNETILESLERLDCKDRKPVEYHIMVSRENGFIPRFRIEEYTTKLIIMEESEDNLIADFYISKYFNREDVKSKAFVREVEHIRDDKKRSDILKFDFVSFITNNAYGQEDMMFFDLEDFEFISVKEFDGSYILRFSCKLTGEIKDMTDQYYCKEMDDKYKNNEPKELVLDVTGAPVIKKYVCSECGKEVTYDTSLIDNMDASDEASDEGITEYMDLEMSEQTFGKKLCRECLNKKLGELKSIYEKKKS